MSSFSVFYIIIALISLMPPQPADRAELPAFPAAFDELVNSDAVLLKSAPGRDVTAIIRFTIAGSATLLTSDSDEERFTHLVVEPTPYFDIGTPVIGGGNPLQIAASTYDLASHTGELLIYLPITVMDDVPEGYHEIQAVLHYQACDESHCFPLRTIPFEVGLEIERGADCGCTPAACRV